MTKVLFILTILFVFVSCGAKAPASKAKFKIFSGNITDPMITFPGGLIIMGRSLDGTQSFKTVYQPGLEIEIKKGSWEFATIGWIGANPMEGNQQCSHQSVEISTDSFTINFDMSYQGCLNLPTLEGKMFSHPIFYNYLSNTYNGFKKLQVKTCPDIISDCSTSQADPVSFKVEIPGMMKGVIANAAAGISLVSNCISGSVSNVTPPYGGPSGFIGVSITTFSGASCAGTPKTYFFMHGFGEVLNETFLDSASNTVIRKGALTVDAVSPYPIVSLDPLNFLGAHTSVSTLPTPVSSNDLYMYKGGATMSVSPNAPNGSFIYYDGSSWTQFAETASVKLILQD